MLKVIELASLFITLCSIVFIQAIETIIALRESISSKYEYIYTFCYSTKQTHDLNYDSFSTLSGYIYNEWIYFLLYPQSALYSKPLTIVALACNPVLE